MQVICILAGKVATAEREDEKFFLTECTAFRQRHQRRLLPIYRIYSIIIPISEYHKFGQAKVSQ